jgi:hypothetical protein
MFDELSDIENDSNILLINSFSSSNETFYESFDDQSFDVRIPNYEENILNNRKCDEFKSTQKKNIEKQSKIGRKRMHHNSSFDNIQTKIQVHFFSFIVNVTNDALYTQLGTNDFNFKDISYEIKRNIRHDNVEKLKNSQIGDILKLKISKKYKKFNESMNYETFNKVCEKSEWLKDFFKINYLILFKYYYNNCKKLEKITFKEKDIFLSKKTESFYDLLEKKINKDIRNKLIDTVKSVYFNGYDTLIEKGSFMSIKNGIELMENI